ncbi:MULTISPECIES: TonB-dependent siderophore receptor [unclassified Pseudomonas]|uniref:TonB-dependent siderophore receptor n=1 Tax=unclassified Pseudomonas TaxID=196821 RepID=UPI00244B9512|nr:MULTISPECIES: TonB-dependent siderophore receptor [unclassified Pseudomonas]MDG9924593.1 TonB-dependent siderophore receptor [Pseudomonas sp. GD04045]MDH0033534.1 TonB-dependent siderophore receptor [Pseudomonas sp. GD04019]
MHRHHVSPLAAAIAVALSFASAAQAETTATEQQKEAVQLEATQIEGQGLAGQATTEGTKSYTTGAMATGTKLPLSIRETPQSVSVITRQRIEDQGMEDLNDVVKYTPGLTVNQYGPARQSYKARGFEVDNIMYDGMPTSISTYTQDVISAADLAIYDRVEIVRGATGLMQGAGNPSAAINLVRKRPTATPQASISGSAGSWDTYRTEVDVSGPLNSEGTIRGRAVTAYQTNDSFQDYVSGERGLLYAIGEMDLTDATTLTIGASYQNDNRNDNWVGLPSKPGGEDFGFDRDTYYGADWSYWDTKTTQLFSDIEHRFDNGWKMKLAMNKMWGRIHMLGMYNSCYYTACDTIDQGGGQYVYTDDHSSYDAVASGPFQLLGREHELVVGTSYREEAFDGHGGWGDIMYSDGSGPAVGFDPDDWDPSNTDKPSYNMRLWGMKTDETQTGTYVTSRFNVADPLKVIVGARLDWHEFETETDSYKVTRNLTRYAGAIYDLNDTYSVYASYTDIFKPQQAIDASGSVLKPIEGENYEIGLKGEYLDGAVNATVALFQVDQLNRAVEDTSGPTPCPSNPISPYCQRASGKVRSQGLDFEVSGALTENWNASASYTYVEAKYKQDANEDNEGEYFDPTIPRHLYKLATVYNLPGQLNQWRVGGDVISQSSTESPEGYQQEDYSLVGLMVGYKVNENIDTRININNLFDKHYYSGIDFGNLNYGAPRNAMFSVKWTL